MIYAKMRLGYISTYPPTHCGVGEYTKLLLNAMASQNPWLELIVFSNRSLRNERFVRNERFDRTTGPKIFPVFEKLNKKTFINILEKLQDIGGVDVLHVQHEYGIYGINSKIIDITSEAKKEKLAKRIIYTLHTVYDNSIKEKNKIKIQDFILSEADIVVVLNEKQKTILEKYNKKIKIIPHGSLINPFEGLISKENIIKKFNLDKYILNSYILGLFGFLRYDKGINLLVSLLQNYRYNHPLTIIIGGEPRDPSVTKILDEISNKNNIIKIYKYLKLNELLMLITLSDAITLPYYDSPGKYAVSGILHLAIGSKRPIIGSDAPRLYELYKIAPKFIFEQGNLKNFIKKINYLIKNKHSSIINNYINKFYLYAKYTSWYNVASEHINIYYKLLKNNNL